MLNELWPFHRFLTEGGPVLAFALGLLWVIYKVLRLWITKHYEKMTPLYERQTAAVEKLAATADRMAVCLLEEQRLTAISLRAVWDELKTIKMGAGTL